MTIAIKQIKKRQPTNSALSILMRYLMRDKNDHRMNRAADELFFNLPSDTSLYSAEADMHNLALQNTRADSSSKFAHYVLSLSQGEHLTHEQWQESISRLIKAAGLEGHQAIAVRHDDTDNEHWHLVINRINPQNLKRIEVHQEIKKMDQERRKLEAELGLTQSRDGHTSKAEKTAQNLEVLSGRQSFTSYMLNLAEPLKKAASWQEFNALLEQNGIKFVKHGRGYVFASNDDKFHVKASDVSRELTIGKLEQKFKCSIHNADLNVEKKKRRYERQLLALVAMVTPTARRYVRFLGHLDADAIIKRANARDDLMQVTSEKITLSDKPSFATIKESLILAIKTYGTVPKVSGTISFQMRAVRAAMALGVPVQCADLRVQAMQEQMQQKNKELNQSLSEVQIEHEHSRHRKSLQTSGFTYSKRIAALRKVSGSDVDNRRDAQQNTCVLPVSHSWRHDSLHRSSDGGQSGAKGTAETHQGMQSTDSNGRRAGVEQKKKGRSR